MNWTIGAVCTAIGAMCTVLGVVISYVMFLRNRSKDDTATGKQTGTLLTEIGYIKGGVDDIKRKQEKQDDQYHTMSERVTAVEQSAKQAHHRIDRLEASEHHINNTKGE